jgi:predicted RNase H-like nuclease (RuvC/YqgF family)
MKTPKRQTGLPSAVNIFNQKHSRWKRKNRETQYKRTIKRLKEENEQLKRTIARLEKEKTQAYHDGHKAGYDLCFARSWF